MFKRIVTHRGFWKSFVVLSIIYGVLMYLISWGLKGDWGGIVRMKTTSMLLFVFTAFLVGFIITYGKFWKKLKEEEYRNKR